MVFCKNCKFWGKDGKEKFYLEYFDSEGNEIKTAYEIALCNHTKLLFCEPPYEKDGFSISDASGYKAWLTTAEGFGCIKGELKKKI